MSAQEKNIVVVDDDTGMNHAIQRLLNAAGFRVMTFPSAETFLASGAIANASCLVLDIHLPGLSGFELHQQLHRAGTDTPVIFITAYDDADSHTHARKVGAVAYFTKPFSGHRFVAAVSQALGTEPIKNHP